VSIREIVRMIESSRDSHLSRTINVSIPTIQLHNRHTFAEVICRIELRRDHCLSRVILESILLSILETRQTFRKTPRL